MVTAETTAASSISELIANNEPDGSGLKYNEPNTVSAGDEKENKSKEEVAGLESEKLDDTTTFDGDVDASKCNGKEESAEDNASVQARETTEDVQEKRETTSATELDVDEALAVSDSNVEGDSGMENSASQDLIGENGLTGSPSDALTGTKKEETKDDANIAGEVKKAPKKKVKRIVKKKILKRKAVAANDESKSPLVEMPKPIIEVSTNEEEEKPDVNAGGKVTKAGKVRKIAATQSSENDGPAANVDAGHQEEPASQGRVKKQRKRKRSGQEAAKVNAGAVTTDDKDKAGQTTQNKSSTKAETSGMIFMCSSKTRKECFQYKIFGLPASKRDMVLNIYEGMRLFLFDFQSRKLNGIYKAAGPGGYNIEPKAFNSAFPAQVRFTTLKEYSPLPEEEFKDVIKDNYFSKNKFDCQLNAEQVRKLCKLFIGTSKDNKSAGKTPTQQGQQVSRDNRSAGKTPSQQGQQVSRESAGKTPRAGTLTISEQQKKRKRAENNAGQEGKKKGSQGDAKQDSRKKRAQVDSRQDRNKKRAQDYAKQDRNKRSAQVDTRLDRQMRRAKVDRRRSPPHARRSPHTRRSPQARHPLHTVTTGNPRPVMVYEREAYAPEPVPAYVPEPVPAVSYVTLPRSAVSAYGLNFAYGRTPGTDIYRQETAVGRTSAADIYRQDAAIGRTSGGDIYRQDTAIGREDQRVAYSGLRYLDEGRSDPYQYTYAEPAAYRDPQYLTSARPDYYSSAATQEYLPSSSRASYYEVPLPPHRRY